MTHQLTISYRNLDQFLAEVAAFSTARQAALVNLENQFGEFQAGRQNLLNGLQAISDWGNAVAQEARAVTRYNAELANLERQTGTILQTHGVVFVEERYASLGPLGQLGNRACYPFRMSVAGQDLNRYPDTGKAAEDSFDLNDLGDLESKDRRPPEGSNEPSVPPKDKPADRSGEDAVNAKQTSGILSDFANKTTRRSRLFQK
jgi:hypothetical protein